MTVLPSKKHPFIMNFFDSNAGGKDETCSFGETKVGISKKIERFALEISDYQDSDAREKKMTFALEHWCCNVLFLIVILMKDIEPIRTEK